MSLTRPTFDVDNIQDLGDIIQNQKATLKALFDKTGADIKAYLMSLLDEIEIDFATKEEVAGIILGQITDGSLTDVKLSDAPGQIKERLTNLADDLKTRSDELYKINAEQNIQIWELEADVIQTKEAMSGWQGDGLFNYQNEVDTKSHITPVRGSTIGEGGFYFGDPEPSINFKDITTITGIAQPSSNSYCAMSSDDKYFAIGTESPTELRIYKRNGEVYDLLKTVVTSGSVNGVVFSPNGAYLAIVHVGSPHVTFYKLNAEGTDYTALANPGTLPTGIGYGVDFDSTGTYCAVAHETSPFVTIYKRTDDTFNKISNPATLPSNIGYSISFGTTVEGYTYLAVGHAGSYYGVTVYLRTTGDTFVKQTTPSLSGSYISGNSVSFSPDATYLALGLNATPYAVVLKRSGTTFSLLKTFSEPTSSVDCVKFSPDGNYLLGATNSAYALVYKRTTDSFSTIGTYDTLNLNGTLSGCFSSDNQYLHLTKYGVYKAVAYKDNTLVPTSGSVTLKPVTLPQVSNSIFLLEESVLDTGVTLQYEVSLDGGTTWEVITKFGEILTLGHTGTELVVKASYTRAVSGVGEGKINWLICWGGAV